MKQIFSVCMSLFLITGWAQQNFAELKLDDENDFSDLEMMRDTLNNYKVYFTGENHNYASFNTKLEFKMLRYLYDTQGVRHFVFEQSPGVGYIINRVILHNEKKNLHFLKDVFYDPFYYLVKDLNKFNDSLKMEDKIKIHGIDVERFPYFSVYALNQIVDTLDTKGDGGEIFEQIKALHSSEYEYGSVSQYYAEEEETGFIFGEVSAWGSLKSIIEGSREKRDSIAPLLGENEEIYFAIIDGLEKGREWYICEKKGDLGSPITRERYMCDEFERIYRKDPNGKYYGQFGRCHLHKDEKAKKCYDYYMNSVTNRINEIDSSLKNQVIVIPVYYSKARGTMDKDIIKALEFEEQFAEDDKAFVIDLAYKNGDHPIVGFYDKLPYVIISNKKVERSSEFEFSWNTTIQEYHLGAYYGFNYFSGVSRLNAELATASSLPFTNKMVGWEGAFDVFTVGSFGSKTYFKYYPEINNGDRFDLKGWQFGLGTYYTWGNKWAVAAAGLNYGYGQFSLTEDLNDSIPNLIQSPDVGNVIIYRNDLFSLDPNIELRLTLPFISLNFRAGYAFDVSGKFWRLDGKMKNFAKTSFSHPYIQAGISFNYKVER